jgi:hypothetical protein
MKRRYFILVFLIAATHAFSQSTIDGYEYWFNADYGNKTKTAVVSAPSLTIDQSVPTDGLPHGINSITFRSYNNSGVYSSTVTHYFYKTSATESSTSPQVVECQYWLDDNYAQAVTVSTPSQELVNIDEVLSVSTLQNGLHRLNFRFKDNTNLYSSTVTHYFYKTSATESNTASQVVECQYWIDDNYAEAVTEPNTAQELVNVDELLSVSTLQNGLHRLNFRFKDNTNLYSSTVTHYFYKTSATESNTAAQTVAYQYWIDDDFSQAVTVNTTAQELVNVDELLSMGMLNNGLHRLNIRFKDNTNMWSSTLTNYFYKTSVSETNASPQTVAYQYWIDNDYAQAVTVNTTAQELVNVDELLSTSSLIDGVHHLHIRFKDNANVWSSTISHLFYKTPERIVAQNEIIQYRYWFDDDFASAVYVALTPSQEANVADGLYVKELPKGMHQILLQCKDVNGFWSVVVADSIQKMSLPRAAFAFNTVAECDSTTLTFIDNSKDGDVYAWDFGDGTTSELASPEHIYYTPGTYVISQTVIDTTAHLDSTIVQTIDVTGNTFASLDATQCEAYTSPSGIVYTVSGVYADTISNHFGCDSIITLNVTIVPLPNVEVTQDGSMLTAVETDATFQWLDCDNESTPIGGETNQSYTASVSGNYAVQVTKNNCKDTSDCYEVIPVGILENTFDHNIVVYPNPTDGMLKVDLGETLPEFTVSIMDVKGNILNTVAYQNIKLFEMTVDYMPGMYLLKIDSGKKKVAISILKK